MCDFCKNIGIGIPDWDFLTPDENGMPLLDEDRKGLLTEGIKINC